LDSAPEKQPEILPADIVVDCTGANSRMPRWLAAAGNQVPEKLQQRIDLRYSSCRFVLSETLPEYRMLSVYPVPPNLCRGGAVHATERGDALVSLFGYRGDYPPSLPSDYLEFAFTFARPTLGEVLKGAVPSGPASTFHILNQHWWRYDTITMPAGLLVVGDAYCRLDPLFGQGMSLGIFQAKALQQVLTHYGSTPGAMTVRFNFLCRRLIQIPWLLATSAGRNLPQNDQDENACPMIKALMLSFLDQYLAHFYDASSTSRRLHALFLDVMHMVRNPFSLFRPDAVALTAAYAIFRKAFD
jgi:hypothetical protein